MDAQTNLPITLRPNRLRAFGALCGSLCLTALSIWMVARDPLIGYLGAAFFGSAILLSTISLFPGSSYLQLTEDGFTICSLFRKTTTRWTDVDRFSEIEIGYNYVVSWLYTKDHVVQETGARVSITLADSEAALPDTYGMEAKELVELMNELLEIHGRT